MVPLLSITVPADCVPSPHVMAAAKSPPVLAALLSVNVATVPLKTLGLAAIGGNATGVITSSATLTPVTTAACAKSNTDDDGLNVPARLSVMRMRLTLSGVVG